jgi:tRNA-intron endonuclease
MLKGVLAEDKVIAEGKEAKELYEKSWYGEMKESYLELELIEACLLLERGRIEIIHKGKKVSLKDFINYCCNHIERFLPKYIVYKDLRERGLPVRVGFNGFDFRVYERGAKPSKHSSVKWIVFAYSENEVCGLDELERTAKLAKNVRALALWGVVDNDSDVTYYIINRKTEL